MTGPGTRLAALALALAATSACFVQQQGPPPAPHGQGGGIAATPDADVRPAQQPLVMAQATEGTFLVAGCNVECAGCTALDGKTFVVGTLDRTGETLFAGPPSAGVAFSCGAAVRFGERVTLRAQTAGAFVFDRWRLFDPRSNDYCPCARSRNPVCRIDVQPGLASRHGRAYCGAVWRPRAGAVLAAGPVDQPPLPPGCRPGDPRRFTTPDGALLLAGNDELTLGPGPHRFTRICVSERARLAVCGQTVLEISGDATSVIAGRGIGPSHGGRADIVIAAAGKPTLAILFDNLTAPIRASFEAPGAPEVYVAITGKTGLELAGGPLQKVITNAGWGDTHNFPACGAPPASIAR